MKQVLYSVIALMVVCCYSCSNHELEDFQGTDIPKNDVEMLSRSAGEIDYSQYTLLENRTIMPRTGETYSGTISYRDLSFNVVLFWDFEFEYYNMFGYIYGSVLDLAGDTHYMQHVATYSSNSTDEQLCYIIKCNYIIDDSGFERYNHVSFYVAYTPRRQELVYNVIEEGEGLWGDPDLEL